MISLENGDRPLVYHIWIDTNTVNFLRQKATNFANDTRYEKQTPPLVLRPSSQQL